MVHSVYTKNPKLTRDRAVLEKIFFRLDFAAEIDYNITVLYGISRCVGMADEGDSKSLVRITRVGSTPTTGIKRKPSSLSGGASFLSAACERVEQHDPAQQGSNQPCGLLLSARETPTTGIASSSKSKGFGLLFFFCSVSYTLVFSGKILTIAFAEDTLSRAISVTVPLTFAVTTVC